MDVRQRATDKVERAGGTGESTVPTGEHKFSSSHCESESKCKGSEMDVTKQNEEYMSSHVIHISKNDEIVVAMVKIRCLLVVIIFMLAFSISTIDQESREQNETAMKEYRELIRECAYNLSILTSDIEDFKKRRKVTLVPFKWNFFFTNVEEIKLRNSETIKNHKYDNDEIRIKLRILSLSQRLNDMSQEVAQLIKITHSNLEFMNSFIHFVKLMNYISGRNGFLNRDLEARDYTL